MFPRARRHHLIVQELDRELLVYDEERHRAHRLNESSSLVWRLCDGEQSIDDITRIVTATLDAPVDREVVWLVLARLEEAHLLEQALLRPRAIPAISRTPGARHGPCRSRGTAARGMRGRFGDRAKPPRRVCASRLCAVVISKGVADGRSVARSISVTVARTFAFSISFSVAASAGDVRATTRRTRRLPNTPVCKRRPTRTRKRRRQRTRPRARPRKTHRGSLIRSATSSRIFVETRKRTNACAREWATGLGSTDAQWTRQPRHVRCHLPCLPVRSTPTRWHTPARGRWSRSSAHAGGVED